VDPPGINICDWEVCHKESRITVSSGCPDTFDQIVYIKTLYVYNLYLVFVITVIIKA
jgi:hypothetical protein